MDPTSLFPMDPRLTPIIMECTAMAACHCEMCVIRYTTCCTRSSWRIYIYISVYTQVYTYKYIYTSIHIQVYIYIYKYTYTSNHRTGPIHTSRMYALSKVRTSSSDPANKCTISPICGKSIITNSRGTYQGLVKELEHYMKPCKGEEGDNMESHLSR